MGWRVSEKLGEVLLQLAWRQEGCWCLERLLPWSGIIWVLKKIVVMFLQVWQRDEVLLQGFLLVVLLWWLIGYFLLQGSLGAGNRRCSTSLVIRFLWGWCLWLQHANMLLLGPVIRLPSNLCLDSWGILLRLWMICHLLVWLCSNQFLG